MCEYFLRYYWRIFSIDKFKNLYKFTAQTNINNLFVVGLAF